MVLATRCPFCETVFRLAPAHLSLRRGLVRCGHCQEVFDASSSLYELDDSGDFSHARSVTVEEVALRSAPPARDAAVDEPASALHETEPSVAPHEAESSIATREALPSAESYEAEPASALPETESSVTPYEAESSIATHEAAPSAESYEAEPASALRETETSVTPNEAEPSIATHEAAPPTELHAVEPTSALPETESSVTSHEVEPSITQHEAAPSTESHDVEPASALHETEPSVAPDEVEPLIATHEAAPSTESHDTEPASALPETDPWVTPHQPEPSTATHEAAPWAPSDEAEPASTLPGTEPWVTPHEAEPSIATHEASPSTGSHVVEPASALPETHSSVASHEAEPSIATHDAAPSTESHEAEPAIRHQPEPIGHAAAASFGVAANAPDFRAESWNPWAPAPDAVIDRNIRHNASTIPYKPVTIPSGAQPKLKLELTEPQPLHLENATARSSDATVVPPTEPTHDPLSFAAHAQPAAEPEHMAQEPAHAVEEPDLHATPGPYLDEPRAPAAEPEFTPPVEPEAAVIPEPVRPHVREPIFDPDDDGTLLPPYVPDNEPHFGTPRVEPFTTGSSPGEPFTAGTSPGEPFAARPFTTDPFAPDVARENDNAFTVVREMREQLREPEPRRTGRQIAGVLVAVLLTVILIVQLAWWQRESVMVYWPQTRMLFAQACQQLDCSFSPPRDIDGLQVEPSDLRQVDGPHKLELKMPLHNRFNVALAYPAVELTLLDSQNNIAVRRILWPQDYVKPGTQIEAGLPPHITETMIVRLDTDGAVATNFRVQIFYP
jgi:predicted Zn finger-like uncharacterized protein